MIANRSDTSQTASSIQCSDVTVEFDRGARAVDSVDLKINSGEILALIGPSGCGKTTLLRAIAGLQSIDAGRVDLAPALSAADGEIGFVFQQPALLPWATTLQNIMLPLELIGWGSAKQRESAALDALHAVRLSGAQQKRPHELSGGMQMRASIARALVTSPSVLLLDEPFAALDEMLRTELGRLLLTLWQERQFTCVMVTHNVSESILLSHRIAVMRSGVLGCVIENPLSWPRSVEAMRTPEFASFFGVVSDRLRGKTPGGVADDEGPVL